VSSVTIEDTPAYAAGLDRGDEIVRFDGDAVESGARIDQILQRHRPGDRLTVTVRRGERSVDLVVVAQGDPRLELVPAESLGTLTPTAHALRNAWLESKQ
jgi:S1-C subfamily serine protease